MNNNNTPLQDNQDENVPQQPPFEWEAPILHTEDWLKTLSGGDTSNVENSFYHT